MTRRTRLEAKVDRRHEWAEKADVRATAAFARADKISERFYGGQPILVGHHSEAGARADQKRIHNAMDRGCEEQAKAEYHERKADGIANQLDHTIYADDDNATEALEARIAEREQKAAQMAAVNGAWRKSKGDAVKFAALAGISEGNAQGIASRIATAYSWEKQPYPAWELNNLRANIRRDRERIEQIRTQSARTEQAEQSESGITIEGDEWVRVTFAEKPERGILEALKAASFRWGQGSWIGPRAKLPEGINA
jgi:hypothetical protein